MHNSTLRIVSGLTSLGNNHLRFSIRVSTQTNLELFNINNSLMNSNNLSSSTDREKALHPQVLMSIKRIITVMLELAHKSLQML